MRQDLHVDDCPIRAGREDEGDKDDMKVAIGLDIGGTKIAAGVVDSRGDVLTSRRIPTGADGTEILGQVVTLVTELRTWTASRNCVLSGCGIGTAGVIVNNKIASANTLIPGWAGQPLSANVESAIEAPVVVLNDVHASALGEYFAFHRPAPHSLAVVAIGTGVGGAFVLDGRLLQGNHGLAGSIGHIPSVIQHGRRCACGATDHVESYVGGRAMEDEYAAETGVRLTLHEIARRAGSNDGIAARLIREAGEVLGNALTTIAEILDPRIIILNGGVIAIGHPLLDPAYAILRNDAMLSGRVPDIAISSLHGRAAIIGAASAALNPDR